ncbi:MAG: metal-sensitive transcriptional regulator [Candidatus Baltobacteraceae bacterium]
MRKTKAEVAPAARRRAARSEPSLSIDPDAAQEITARLARVEGQVRAIARMIEERRDCHVIVQQMAAARTALERATAQLMVSSLAQCIRTSKTASEESEIRRLTETFIKLL